MMFRSLDRETERERERERESERERETETQTEREREERRILLVHLGCCSCYKSTIGWVGFFCSESNSKVY
jgi:hypothetical protein